MLLNCGAGEDSWESLNCKQIKTVNLKGNQLWIFIGRTDSEVEAPILWLPDTKSLLIRKDPDAGKDWRQEENGMTESKVIGWPHWLNGHELVQASGDGEGQGSLTGCSSWGQKTQKWLSHWTTTLFLVSLDEDLYIFIIFKTNSWFHRSIILSIFPLWFYVSFLIVILDLFNLL